MLKGTHLPLTITEIQAGYLTSAYFKDNIPIFGSKYVTKKCHVQGRNLVRKVYLTRFLTV